MCVGISLYTHIAAYDQITPKSHTSYAAEVTVVDV